MFDSKVNFWDIEIKFQRDLNCKEGKYCKSF